MTDWINEVLNIVKETFATNPKKASQLEEKLRSHSFDVPFASQPSEPRTVKLRRISERRNSSPGVKADAPRATKRRHTTPMPMPVLTQKRYTTTPQPTSKRQLPNASLSTSPPKKRKRTLSSILRAQQTRSDQEQKEREHMERLRKQKERRAAMEEKRKLQKRNSKPSWEPIVPVLRRKKPSTRPSSNEDERRRTRLRKIGKKKSKPCKRGKPYKKHCITTIDISDYENSSDDEATFGRRTADWARNIKSQVAKQRTMNPEEVFGRITEPSFHVISDVFFSPNPNNAKLSRGPTPTRPLQLSQEEIESYDRHMGFV